MATHVKILSPKEIFEFDEPPELNFEQRRTCFYLTASLNRIIQSLNKPVSKVGLVLQFGYYKYSGKFYKLKSFHSKDVKFILCDLFILSLWENPQIHVANGNFIY
jgi:hypothetical protein